MPDAHVRDLQVLRGEVLQEHLVVRHERLEPVLLPVRRSDK